MRLFLPLLAIVPFLNSCGGYGRVALEDAPKVVNVSSYDPKEKQRAGESFSPTDVSALKRNGAQGLIARCGKGTALDDKCADFLKAAERSGMRLGTYYFVLKTSDPVWQADQYIARLRQIAPGRKVLLVGDFDTKSNPADLVKFIDRIEQTTGVLPAIYLENSDRLRSSLSSATSAQKRRIRQCPYWIALYSHGSGFTTPKQLMKASGRCGSMPVSSGRGARFPSTIITAHGSRRLISAPWTARWSTMLSTAIWMISTSFGKSIPGWFVRSGDFRLPCVFPGRSYSCLHDEIKSRLSYFPSGFPSDIGLFPARLGGFRSRRS